MSGKDAALSGEAFDKVIKLTADALKAVLHEDWESAQNTVRAVGNETGFEGFFLMLTAAADWSIQAQVEAQGGKAPEGAVEGRPGWVNEKTGAVSVDAESVDPAERWAGQFVTARAAMDHDMTIALADALPEECGRHVFVLLASCGKWLKMAGRAS